MHADLCETLAGSFSCCLYTKEVLPSELHTEKGMLLKIQREDRFVFASLWICWKSDLSTPVGNWTYIFYTIDICANLEQVTASMFLEIIKPQTLVGQQFENRLLKDRGMLLLTPLEELLLWSCIF